MSEPTISVVIPSFNRQDSTVRAIVSAVKQSRAIEEIIVVDDASAPAFDLSRSGLNDRRITVLRLDANLGPAGARQAGVGAAKSDLVAFLDSDDIWLPGKIESQLALYKMAGPGLHAISCGWRGLPLRGPAYTRHPLPSSRLEDFASGCWFSPGSTLLIARSAFAQIGPFKTTLRRMEDYEWFLRFALAGGSLLVAPVVGAELQLSRNSRMSSIDPSVKAIMAEYHQQGSTLDTRCARLSRAYLHLETAAAHRNEGNWTAMVLELSKSFWFAPRRQLPVKPFWTSRPGGKF